MGIDATMLFVPEPLGDDIIIRLVREVVKGGNVAVLIGRGASVLPSAAAIFEHITITSLWGDNPDESIDILAERLSAQTSSPVLALTVADHACVGGFQVFRSGATAESDFTEGEEYLELPWRGFNVAYGQGLFPSESERCALTGDLIANGAFIVVQTTNPELPVNTPLSHEWARRIVEDDVPGALFECTVSSAG